MKKHDVTYMIAVAALSVTLLSGCTNERMEDELGFRDIGIADMQKGDYDGAIVAFGSALAQCAGEITDTEIDICYYKAAALYASGDTQGAYDTYQALIDYNKDDGNAYYLMGCLDLQNGNTDTAVSNFEKAVNCNKNDYKLYIGIYEDLAAYNMKEQGEEYLNKAFDIKGNSAEDLTNRGRIYYLLGQYDNAKEELAAAIKKESKEANLYLAQVYEAEGDSEQAETYYQAYTDSGIADSTAMNALAEIEMGRGITLPHSITSNRGLPWKMYQTVQCCFPTRSLPASIPGILQQHGKLCRNISRSARMMQQHRENIFSSKTDRSKRP